MKKSNITKTTKLYKAALDQILVWIMMFTFFVTLLFFVIDYSNVMRTNDNLTSIAIYASKALSKNIKEEDVIDGINKLKFVPYEDITKMTKVSINKENHQLIITVEAEYKGTFFDTTLSARNVVFNEYEKYETAYRIKLELKNEN